MSDNKEIKFEDAMTRLEQIVNAMESGKLPLDETIKYFTEAAKLADFCEKKLSDFEKRIEVLTVQNGQEQWGEFPADQQ